MTLTASENEGRKGRISDMIKEVEAPIRRVLMKEETESP